MIFITIFYFFADYLTIKELEDQLMGIRIREADAVAESKEMRQKVMELETQVCYLRKLFIEILI